MKTYKAIMYDWDGCLVQSLRVWVDAYKQVLDEAGITVSSSDIMSRLGNWDAAGLLGHPDQDAANQDIIHYVEEHIENAELYPNVLDTIIDLKADHSMQIFIVTATKREIAQSTKAFRDIEPLIDFAVFADDVQKHKPDPEAINLLLDKFNLDKSEVLMVGDSAKDMEAAQNAGVDSVWFAPVANKGFHTFDKIASLDPTITIEDHLDIFSSCKQTLPTS